MDQPLPLAVADEVGCIAGWLDAEAARVRLEHCDSGLASPFLGGSAAGALVTGVPLAALAAVRGPGGIVAVLAGVVAGVGVVALARRRIGGFTGDVLGAAGLVTETVALVVMSARW